MEQAKKQEFLTNVAYIAVIILLIFLAIRYLSFLLLPFLLGMCIAVVLRPVTKFIAYFTKMSGRASAIFAAACFYLLLFILLWLAGTILFVQLEGFVRELPQLYADMILPMAEKIGAFSIDMLTRFSQEAGQNIGAIYEIIGENVQQAILALSGNGIQSITNLIKKIPMLCLTTIFTIITSVMICSDWQKVTRFLMRQITYSWQNQLIETHRFLFSTLSKIIKAYLIIMFITFLELVVGLWMLGVQKWFYLAILIAVLDLLPLIGSGGILIPWGIYWLLSGNYAMGGGLLILWGIIAVVRQFIEPKIVGDQIGLHPIITISAMYIGLRIMGFIGLILAPILALLIKYLNDSGQIKLYR